jgi:hypothetical protein
MMKNACNVFQSSKNKGRGHVSDLDIDERMVSERIFEKRDFKAGTGLNWLLIGSYGSFFFKHDSELSSSLKPGNFLIIFERKKSVNIYISLCVGHYI